MPGGLNRIIIIGNVGRDPEGRYTQEGKPVTTFSVGVNDRKDNTEWFNVVTWDKLAETCNQYVRKGQKVCVEGRMQTRSWEGQDGERKYRTELVANSVLFLSPKAGQKSEGYDGEDDLPF